MKEDNHIHISGLEVTCFWRGGADVYLFRMAELKVDISVKKHPPTPLATF